MPKLSDLVIEWEGHRVFNENAQHLGEYRKLTDAEVAQLGRIKQLNDESAALILKAKALKQQVVQVHPCETNGHLVYDTAGLPYDVRHCLVCGMHWSI